MSRRSVVRVRSKNKPSITEDRAVVADIKSDSHRKPNFNSWYQEKSKVFRRFIFRLASDIEQSKHEEILQQCFYKLVSAIRGGADIADSLMSYMFTIIRRHITDIRKSRKFRDDQLTIRTDDGFFGKGVSSTADQRYIAVDQIESIKNEQLRAVTKMLLAGMTYAEVAKELGVSVATIANRVSTIREIFRRRLTQS